MTSPVLDAIRTRRSIRDFTTQAVEDRMVREILGLPDSLALMTILAIGHPAHHNPKSRRNPLEEFLIKEL